MSIIRCLVDSLRNPWISDPLAPLQPLVVLPCTAFHEVCLQPSAGSGDDAWEQTFPASVLQFLGLVHSTYPQDPAWRAPEFLQMLAAVTFPLGTHKVGHVTALPSKSRDKQHHASRAKREIFPYLHPKLKCILRQLG